MELVSPPTRTRRVRRVLVLTLLIALFIVSGCGKSGDKDKDPPGPNNNWDEMRWDASKWG